MKVEQFVMAYQVEQDRLRAMLPEGFESLRPVLRINTEIRKTKEIEVIYIEFNTPVSAFGKRGWLNIACWESPAVEISREGRGKAMSFYSPFLEITYTGVGVEGGCPAEKDNEGCFFIGQQIDFIPTERVDANREFCDCNFRWKFTKTDACGISSGGKSIPAILTVPKKEYEKQELSPQAAAAIACEQVLGSYVVRFERPDPWDK